MKYIDKDAGSYINWPFVEIAELRRQQEKLVGPKQRRENAKQVLSREGAIYSSKQ